MIFLYFRNTMVRNRLHAFMNGRIKEKGKKIVKEVRCGKEEREDEGKRK